MQQLIATCYTGLQVEQVQDAATPILPAFTQVSAASRTVAAGLFESTKPG